MAERIGYIPKTVVYVCAQPETFETCWDGSAGFEGDDAIIHQQTVIPAFPVSGDTKTLENRLATARKWARTDETNQPYQEVSRDNIPFSIQICGLDIRGQGGRAYKVIDTDGHLFDLREDVFFEAFMACGCKPGGYIPGEFIWCVTGSSSMKLVRDGSQLHQEISKAGGRREKAIVPIGQLIPGHLYQNKTLVQKLFLGWVPAPKSKAKWKMVWYEGTPPNFLYGRALVTTSHTMVEDVADYSSLTSDLQQQIIQWRKSNIESTETRHEQDLSRWSRSSVAGTHYSSLPEFLADLAKRQKRELKNLEGELRDIVNMITSLPSPAENLEIAKARTVEAGDSALPVGVITDDDSGDGDSS